ncbi:hypothetical protein G3480_19505 [Thiorhodococcus mannitoliphagus]|uniref:Uncharacterized protein n=1 Tax=Thiorhodococcus mannitoliphagus TaxID=329406 RepID=A0A6P1E0A2_9GAMM|nr:hypothetical protein [Thiorhodococcus mannitoliphagus]
MQTEKVSMASRSRGSLIQGGDVEENELAAEQQVECWKARNLPCTARVLTRFGHQSLEAFSIIPPLGA